VTRKPKPREVRWERMFSDELEAAVAESPVVWFAYGMCEPHGPLNTLGLDALKAHGLCCAAARAHGGVVAPPDYWHVHDLGYYAEWAHGWIGDVRPWLTAVPPWIHFKNVAYQARAADALGFHAGIFLTGHYGPNWEDLKRVLEILQPNFSMRMYGLPDFEANVPGFDGKGADHAGKVETSLLWALEPDCVDPSRLPKIGDDEAHPFGMGIDAREADAAVGRRMVADEVRWLGAKAAELLRQYDEAGAARGPVSYKELERIWAEEIEPLVPEFASMRPGSGRMPADSRWALNYQISWRPSKA
jgi:creatinine amidohydrolase